MNRPESVIASCSRPPPLLAEVDHHGVDVLRLEVVEQLAAVLGGADGVGVAPQDGLGVAVEGRQVDHADLERLAVLGLGLDDLALGVLLAELDLLAGQLVDLPLLGAGRLDDQPDLGARAARGCSGRRR